MAKHHPPQPDLFSPENLDIPAAILENAYAAVEISNGKPIKKLISSNGAFYVCIGALYSPAKGKVPRTATHYLRRVVPIEQYEGKSVSYKESRDSPSYNSYDGVRVTYKKKVYVFTSQAAVELTIED